MTPAAAKIIREKWISEGSLFCLHLTTCLGQTITGYLTGMYFCLHCGNEVAKRID